MIQWNRPTLCLILASLCLKFLRGEYLPWCTFLILLLGLCVLYALRSEICHAMQNLLITRFARCLVQLTTFTWGMNSYQHSSFAHGFIAEDPEDSCLPHTVFLRLFMIVGTRIIPKFSHKVLNSEFVFKIFYVIFIFFYETKWDVFFENLQCSIPSVIVWWWYCLELYQWLLYLQP